MLVMVLLITGPSSWAQKISVSTNLFEWGRLLTYNGELGISLSRHFSIHAGGLYNNTVKPFEDKHYIIQDRQMAFYAGTRFWPWYVNSGWWVGMKGQYRQMNVSGIWRPAYECGDGVGAGLNGGYAIMVGKHLNIEFGASFWAGKYLNYTLYDCPFCLNVRQSEPKWFAAPDDIYISLVILL